MTSKRYIAAKPFTMAGQEVQAGQVVDVSAIDPPKRDTLVRTRYLYAEEVEETKDAAPVKRKRGRPRKHPVAAAG